LVEKTRATAPDICLNSTMIEWVRQADNGNRPEPSAGAAGVAVDGKLWVFGGNTSADPDDPHLSHDLHVFDLETGFWTRCRTSATQPCARAGHCTVAHGSSMYVLCGWTVKPTPSTLNPQSENLNPKP